jgi:hypothetical protein
MRILPSKSRITDEKGQYSFELHSYDEKYVENNKKIRVQQESGTDRRSVMNNWPL